MPGPDNVGTIGDTIWWNKFSEINGVRNLEQNKITLARYEKWMITGKIEDAYITDDKKYMKKLKMILNHADDGIDCEMILEDEVLPPIKLRFDELKLGEWYWIRSSISGRLLGCFELERMNKPHNLCHFHINMYGSDCNIGIHNDEFEFFGPIKLPQILMEDEQSGQD